MIGHPLADWVDVADQPIGVVRMQTLDPAAGAGHAAVGSRASVLGCNVCVTLGGIVGVRSVERSGVNFAFGSVNTTSGLKSRHVRHVVRVNQPVARRHRCAIVKQRGIAHHAGGSVVSSHDYGEVTLRATTKQCGDLLDVGRRCVFSGR